MFPVLLPGVADPFDPNALPHFLRARMWVDFRSGVEDARALQDLIHAVKGIPFGPSAPLSRDDVCPYRGLEVFDVEHGELFFGRDREVQRLIEKLKTTRLLTVLGPSGSGKSSLVRAGLVPALTGGVMAEVSGWDVCILRPGAAPLTSLAVALANLGAERAIGPTLDALGADARTLHLAVQYAVRGSAGRRVLCVVDQLEEVFTLCHDDVERQQLFANLLYAAAAPGGAAVVVLTMRADFYQRCAPYPELAQLVSAHQFLASPMDSDELRQVIEEPARRVGLEFEEGLVAAILNDVGKDPAALPLLEHALLELWKRRRGTMLTLEGYVDTGGVAGALAQRADAIFDAFTDEQRALARALLLRLTQPGEGTEDTRRSAALSELTPAGHPQGFAAVLGALVDARLLTTGGASDARSVDVAHEALIRGWPRLRGWIDADRAGLRVHRRLDDAVGEWRRLDRDESVLYRGVRLDEALEWQARNPELLNDPEREFLAASAELRERERDEGERRREQEVRDARELAAAQARARRRVQWVAAALLIGVLLAGTAAVVALHESATANHQRRLAEARSLVAASTQQLGTDPELSLVLAGEAAKRARTPEVRDALRAALQSPIRLTLRGHRGSIDGLVVSADGRHALTSSYQEPTRVWDLRTGTGGVLRGLAGRGSFSPDGRLVVGATPRSALRIWDASTLRAVGAPFPALHKQAPAAAFSPDGRRILSWSSDHGVMLWDVRTRRRLHLLGDAPGPMPRATVEPVQIDAAFGRDGRLVATVADGRGLEVWDAASGRRLWRHDGWYSGVEFDAAGRRLLTSDYTAGTPNPPVARLWSVAGRRQVASFSPRHGADVAAFAGDDGHVLVDDRLWDPATGDAIRLGSGPYFIDERPRSQAASADGMIVVSAGIGRAEVSDGDTGRRLGTLDAGTSSVTATGLAADGRTILTGHANGTVEVWDRRVVRLRPAGKLVSAVAVSPDGRRIAGLTRSYRVVVWDAATGRIRLRSRHVVLRCGETDLCGPSIQFSADGRRLHVVVGGVAVVLDPATGVTIGKPIATGAQHVAFSRDGRRVAYSDDGEAVRVADAATGATVSRVPVTNGGVGGLALATDGGLGGYTLSTDGEILAINDGPDGLSLWSTASRKRLGRLAGDVSVLDQYGSVALSRDGTRAAAARTDGTTSIVRTDGGRELLRLAGHRGPVLETDFSPDGRFVVTSGSDGTTRVFDAADGRTVATFGSAGAVAMTSDDRRVVVVGERGLPLVYPCEACATWPELAKRVAARTHRALSAAERARFLGG